MTAARDIGKTRARFRAGAPGTRIGWPDVLRVLQDTKTRSEAACALRDAEFTPDDFATRADARKSVVEVLVRREDVLELLGIGARAERAAIREVRRRLEWELWP